MKDKIIILSILSIVLLTSCTSVNSLTSLLPSKKVQFKYSPLHEAVRLNQYNNVIKLINKKDLEVKDSFGDTPILDSTRNNFTKITKVLICNNANINVIDMNKNSLLDLAIKNNNTELVSIFSNNNPKYFCPKKSLQVKKDIIKNKKIIKKDNIKINNLTKKEKTFDDLEFDDPRALLFNTKTPLKIVKKPSKKKALIFNKKAELQGYNEKTNLLKEVKLDNNFLDIPKTEVKIKKLNAIQSELNTKLSSININNISYNKNIFEYTFIRQGELSKELKSNLAIFLPQFISIIKNYKDLIKNLRLENHTSSQYRTKRTKYDKFLANEKLSTKRAKDISSYILLLSKVFSLDPIWLKSNLKAHGMSSTYLIYDSLGVENKALSRRTTLRIVLN